jgi:hypothetical protein
MLTVRLMGEIVTQWSITQGRPVTWLDLISLRRDAWIAQCRHLLCWLARQRTALSYPQIGAALGDRDHTSILYAVRRINQLVACRDNETVDQTVALLAAVDALVATGVLPRGETNTAPDIAARILARPGGAARASVEDIMQLAAAYLIRRDAEASMDLADHWVGLMLASAEAGAAIQELQLRRGTAQEAPAWARLARAAEGLKGARERVQHIHRHTQAGELIAAE